MKECTKCKVEKPFNEFYRDSRNNGFRSVCKICLNKQGAIWCEANKDKKTASIKRWRANNREKCCGYVKRARLNNLEKHNKADKLYRKKFPLKIRAQNAINNRLTRGELFKAPCERCQSDTNVHAHHDDYTQPLMVRWLCIRCHHLWHQKHKAYYPNINQIEGGTHANI